MSEPTTGSEEKEHTPKLLVVDDDPATAELIRQWFAGSMEVLDAPDARRGRSRMRTVLHKAVMSPSPFCPARRMIGRFGP